MEYPSEYPSEYPCEHYIVRTVRIDESIRGSAAGATVRSHAALRPTSAAPRGYSGYSECPQGTEQVLARYCEGYTL